MTAYRETHRQVDIADADRSDPPIKGAAIASARSEVTGTARAECREARLRSAPR
jgi:hypothetical protein